jgi:hypothetical protein
MKAETRPGKDREFLESMLLDRPKGAGAVRAIRAAGDAGFAGVDGEPVGGADRGGVWGEVRSV